MDTQLIALKPTASTAMMGMRQVAVPLRRSIEAALTQGRDVTVDFTGVEATQSFVDELLGVLVSQRGPTVLEHIVLKGCSPTVQGIMKFVLADRARDFMGTSH